MSEEMKLLRAMCEKMGFEVVVDLDYKERLESKGANQDMLHKMDGRRLLSESSGGQGMSMMIKYNDDDQPTSVLIKPETSYSIK